MLSHFRVVLNNMDLRGARKTAPVASINSRVTRASNQVSYLEDNYLKCQIANDFIIMSIKIN